MEVYLVGGAVRDRLLNIPIKERDWSVVGATPEEMEAKGFRRLDREFPVFMHPETGDEYALARRETKVSPGHRGFCIDAGSDVTLEEDLKRRDLTINAMAEAQDGTLIDPFNGRADLEAGILRRVSPAFVEDPLRVLRVARFAARFARWGFRISHGTHALMKRMVESGELAALSVERVWQETERALSEHRPIRYFEVLHRCAALAHIIPELAQVLGSAPSHRLPAKRAVPSALAVLEAATKLSYDPVVRYAALLQGLAATAADRGEPPRCVIETVGIRLSVPKVYQELALLVWDQYAVFAEAERGSAASILAGLESLDAVRRRARFQRYLTVCQAVAVTNGRNPSFALQRIQAAHQAMGDVDAGALAERGLHGAALGAELRRLRHDAIATAVGSFATNATSVRE